MKRSLRLSRRALRDIQQIEVYSKEKWGPKVAEEYLGSIEAALNLLREDSSLLRARPEFSQSLCFYRVQQHFLVCAMFEEQIFVLTVKHGAMDLPNRIAEVEQQLHREAAMLHAAYQKKRGKTNRSKP